MAVISCSKCGAKNRVDESRARDTQPVCGRCGTPLDLSGAEPSSSSSTPVEVTDANFSAVLQAAGETRPVLVDCWAAWCGPCRLIGPTIEQLAAESAGRYVVGKLDVDANPMTSNRYQISSIPALLIFKGGKLVDQLVGVQSKNVIASRLAAHA